MKSILSQKDKYVEQKYTRPKKKPNKDFTTKGFYEGICRVLPLFVAQNYKYFEQLTPPVFYIHINPKHYTRKIKQKIICQNIEDSV